MPSKERYECEKPRKRVGRILLDGKTKQCDIPCSKLKFAYRSDRPDCVAYHYKRPKPKKKPREKTKKPPKSIPLEKTDAYKQYLALVNRATRGIYR